MAYEATKVNGTYPYLIVFAGTWEIWHMVRCCVGACTRWSINVFFVFVEWRKIEVQGSCQYLWEKNLFECTTAEYEFRRELEEFGMPHLLHPYTQLRRRY